VRILRDKLAASSVRIANRLGDPNLFKRRKNEGPTIAIPYIWSATSSSVRPVYEELKKKDYNFVFIVPFPREIFRGVPEADVVITTHYHQHILDAVKDRVAIYYPHGLGSETYIQHDMSPINIALLNGELPDVPRECNYELIGWAKTDILFSSELKERVEFVNKKLKLDELPYDKTLLWCDNQKPFTYNYLWRDIYNWCKDNKVNLLVKGKDRKCGRDYEMIKKPWLRYISSSVEYNVYVLMQFCDVFVGGEGTSAIREAYAINLPSFNLMIPRNKRLYKSQPEMYHVTPDKLDESLRLAFEDNNSFTQPQCVIDRFFSHMDGVAAQRFIEVINRFLP